MSCDLSSFLGEFVVLTIFRKGKFKTHYGRLMTIRGHEIELQYRNADRKIRCKWVPTPRMKRDSIQRATTEVLKI